MHAAHRAGVARERDAVLGKPHFEAMGGELIDAEGACEEAAIIARRREVNEPGAI